VSLLSFECRHRFDSGFDLDIRFDAEHPVTALFGPSGSGKTTVLSIIGGFMRPQRGRVQLGDRVLVDTAAGVELAAEKRRVGYVFQDLLLFPHLVVESNLRYGQRRRGGARGVEFTRVVEVLDLGGLLQRLPRHLSGGERQRVALGRALLSGPELLLMDEPLAAVDAALKSRIVTYLERVVHEWNLPTLFVSHGQGEVRRLAGWVIVLEDGKVVASGTPDDALARDRPLQWKGATGPVNLLHVERAQLRDGHWIGWLGEQELHLPPLESPGTIPLFVQFAPNEVTLSRQDVSGLSARNHLRGQVRQVVELPSGVFVAIDVGQILWSEVTREAARELELQPGAHVTCLIKTHSLRVVY
jgi:molybdate transport system ATP-binding protein